MTGGQDVPAVDAVALVVAGVPPNKLDDDYTRRVAARWLVGRRAELTITADPAYLAEPLQRWTTAVLAEAAAFERLPGAVAHTVPLAVARHLARLQPVLKHIRVLLIERVPRSLVDPVEAQPLLTAVATSRAADVELEQAKFREQADVLRATARTSLFLTHEIQALRDPGAWWGLERHVSDGALNRVRPHVNPGASDVSRHAIADALERLQAVVEAEKRAEAAQAALVRQVTASGVDGAAQLERVVVALSAVCELLLEAPELTDSTDAVWAVPSLSGLSTRAVARLAAMGVAAEGRRPAEAVTPGLAAFPARIAVQISATERTAWADAVVADWPLYEALQRHAGWAEDLRKEVDGSAGVASAATRIGRAFDTAAPNGARADAPLEVLVANAVQASHAAFAVLRDELDPLLGHILDDRDVAALCASTVADLRAALARRAAALATFRIVLFGRTGAGKSSLIEALTRGTGKTISTGVSDYTVDCSEVQWGACRIVDTPGIEGWGRTTTSAELEARAREALDAADLVLLAFDSQGQKEGEFDKAASWILEFDKPVQPILNVRNPKWRRPDKEGDVEARRQQQTAVLQNAQHIHDGLLESGLLQAHPIALQLRAAVAARCDNYRGPDSDVVNELRENVGVERLSQASNLDVLNALLRRLLSEAALDIRLQSMANDARHRLAVVAQQLTVGGREWRAAASRTEAGIEAVLAVTGVGLAGRYRDGERRHREWRRAEAFSTPHGDDDLTRLEALRGAPFGGAALTGAAWDVWEDRWAEHVLPVIRQHTALLEDAVRDAFVAVKVTDADAVQLRYQKAVDTLVSAAGEALQATQTDLRMALGASAATLRARDLTTSAGEGRRVDGASGSANTWMARGLDAASVALVFIPVPGPNVLAAAGVRLLGQLAANFFGRKRREASERQRADEMRLALDEARLTVSRAVDALEDQATTQVRAWICELLDGIRPEIRAAIDARVHAEKCERVSDLLTQLTTQLPKRGSGSAALARVREGLAADGQSWMDAAFGSAWVAAEEGRGAAQEPELRRGPPAGLTAIQAQGVDALRTLMASASQGIDANAFAKWTGESSPSSPQTAADARPAVALTGPRRVGVTSLLGALGATSGSGLRTAPGGAEINPDEADIVALVLPPSLFGSGESLGTYLGLPALNTDTRRRLCFFLTRIDELAGDPDEDAAAFAAAVERKVAELRLFLARVGLPADAPVLPVAGAPWGVRANPSPAWSGVDAVAWCFASGNAGDIPPSIVRNRIAELERGRAQAQDEIERLLGPQASEAQQRERELATLGARGVRLRQRSEARLRRALLGVVTPLAYDVASAGSATALKAAKAQLDSWRARADTGQLFARFEAEVVPEIEEWLLSLQRADQWTLSRPEPAEGAPNADGTAGMSGPGTASSAARTTLKTLGGLSRKLGQRDEYYDLLKQFGHKFKPWEAVKGAQRIRSVTPALAALGGALALLTAWQNDRAAKLRDKLRRDAISEARVEVDTLIDLYLCGSADDPGPWRVLDDAAKALEESLQVAAAEGVKAQEALHNAHVLVTTLEEDMMQGLALLDEAWSVR